MAHQPIYKRKNQLHKWLHSVNSYKGWLYRLGRLALRDSGLTDVDIDGWRMT